MFTEFDLLLHFFQMCGSCHFGKSSNFEIGVKCPNIRLLFCFLLNQKEGWIAVHVLKWNHPTFLYLEGTPKWISHQGMRFQIQIQISSACPAQQHQKHNNKNHSKFNTNFNVQMTWFPQLSIKKSLQKPKFP